MAERRRIVTLDAAGTATVVKDLNASPFAPTHQTTVIKSPPPNAIMAKRERRFGGATTVGEHHDNGSFAWRMLVTGTSADTALANAEAALAVFQSPRNDLFFEWRPEGASNSTFYDLAGTVTWQATYEWSQFIGSFSWYIDIEIPVNPLGRKVPQSFTIASTTFPAVVALTSIGGTAPSFADITVRHSGGSAPIWMMFGWVQHPTVSPISGSVVPFGIIEAETGISLSTWAAIGSDANYRGSNGLRVTTAGAGTASASFAVDPSIIPADDFSDEIQVEVWARIEIDAAVVSPVLKCSLVPNTGSNFGAPAYAAPFGSSGKVVVRPASGVPFRFVRLGVLNMPRDTLSPVKWNVQIDGSWLVGSSGRFGLDYLVLVPANARACSKSGVANDATYPDFITSTADTSKTIRGLDLSGLIGSAALNKGRSSGLGGSRIELPPGDVDLLIKPSSLVPDDPTSDATSELLGDTFTGTVVVTPRVFLAA